MLVLDDGIVWINYQTQQTALKKAAAADYFIFQRMIHVAVLQFASVFIFQRMLAENTGNQ